jgi:hypothetical protein
MLILNMFLQWDIVLSYQYISRLIENNQIDIEEINAHHNKTTEMM